MRSLDEPTTPAPPASMWHPDFRGPSKNESDVWSPVSQAFNTLQCLFGY